MLKITTVYTTEDTGIRRDDSLVASSLVSFVTENCLDLALFVFLHTAAVVGRIMIMHLDSDSWLSAYVFVF